MLRTDPASDESCQGRGHAEISIAVKEPSPFVRTTTSSRWPTTPTVAKTVQLAQSYDLGRVSPSIRRMYHRPNSTSNRIYSKIS
jgi:hypothetical protein